MPESASITVNQDGIKSFASALINPQNYEIYLDGRRVGVLDGYHHRANLSVAPGHHELYVRVYARDSVSITRIYGYSHTLDVTLAEGDRKSFSCGVMTGPPVRKALIFGGTALTIFLWIGIGPIAQLPLRPRYLLVAIAALATYAFSWIGYSSKPGSSIYLQETGTRAAAA